MSDDISPKQMDILEEARDRRERSMAEFQRNDPDGFLCMRFNQANPRRANAFFETENGKVMIQVVQPAHRTINGVMFRGRIQAYSEGMPFQYGEERDFTLELLPTRAYRLKL